ncbi:MAG: coenzyme F420-0:L-glutamate ligase [Candidatus Nanoarchaeia archaeon]|jgi:coenzyme F420-0:L-glutamate ligase
MKDNYVKIIPLKADKIIGYKDNLLGCFDNSLNYNDEALKEKDIVVFSSKVVALCQGRKLNLETIVSSEKAKELAMKYSIDDRLAELIAKEADIVFGGVKEVVLTSLYNNLIANAGIDKSNSGENQVILWPSQPYETAQELKNELSLKYTLNNLGVIISDSHIQPLRSGVIGQSIGVSGFKPVENCIGRKDLFGREMHYTKRAIADQVATAAHLVMGECDEQTPFVIARNIKAEFTDEAINPKDTYVPFENCLFMNSIHEYFKGADLK